MTTIIALKENDKIYLASDSQVSIGCKVMYSDDKVFRKGGMLIGITGCSRFQKIIQFGFSIPEQDKKIDDLSYMNSIFTDSLIECLDKKQYNKKYDSQVDNNSTALICYHGCIYLLSCDYDISVFDCDYMSVGSGSDYAIGSMDTTDDINASCKELKAPKLEPEARLKMAMKSSIKYDKSTGGGIKILSMSVKQ